MDRKTLVNLSLAGGSFLFSLLLVEAILRATIYRNFGYEKASGPSSTYRQTNPEFDTVIKINSRSMRDDEIGEKRPGEYRILCLGDSFTFGVGVNLEDTWLKIAERSLMSRGKSGFRFLNAGGKTAAPVAYEFLSREGMSLRPDMVIVQVFFGNDFYDVAEYEEPASRPAQPQPGPPPRASLRSRISRNIRLIDFLWNRIISIDYADRLLFRQNLRYGNRGIFLKDHPALERRLVDKELDYLGRIARFCDEKKLPLFVLLIPDKLQVLKKDLLTGERYFYRKPNQIMGDFLKENKIRFLDLLDEFEKSPAGELRDYYYVRDLHFTKSGHEFTAQKLLAVLEDMLPGPHTRGNLLNSSSSAGSR